MKTVAIAFLKKMCLALPNDEDLGRWLRKYIMFPQMIHDEEQAKKESKCTCTTEAQKKPCGRPYDDCGH